MKTIYCAISVEQELPTDGKKYTFLKEGEAYCIGWQGEGGEGFVKSHFTHWLKPITSLSDLPEEWKAEIREIAGRAFEAGDKKYLPNAAQNKQEHLKWIL